MPAAATAAVSATPDMPYLTPGQEWYGVKSNDNNSQKVTAILTRGDFRAHRSASLYAWQYARLLAKFSKGHHAVNPQSVLTELDDAAQKSVIDDVYVWNNVDKTDEDYRELKNKLLHLLSGLKGKLDTKRKQYAAWEKEGFRYRDPGRQNSQHLPDQTCDPEHSRSGHSQLPPSSNPSEDQFLVSDHGSPPASPDPSEHQSVVSNNGSTHGDVSGIEGIFDKLKLSIPPTMVGARDCISDLHNKFIEQSLADGAEMADLKAKLDQVTAHSSEQTLPTPPRHGDHVREVRKDFHALTSTIKKRDETITSLGKELDVLQSEKGKRRNEITSLRKELDELKSKGEERRNEITSLREQRDSYKESVQAKSAEIARLEVELNAQKPGATNDHPPKPFYGFTPPTTPAKTPSSRLKLQLGDLTKPQYSAEKAVKEE